MLLALDTATPHVTVAVHDGDQDGGQDGVLVELRSARPMRHAEQVAPLVEEALRRAGLVRQDLTAVAVGVGPGPFTGLRVGLMTARALGLALDIPVYGACSLDVLAVEAAATGTVDRDFVVATDARRKEVYLAAYDAGGARLDGPVVDRPAALAERLPDGVPVVGPGGELYPDAFPVRCGPTAPSAGWLARAVAGELVELRDPDPMYLRRPDAHQPAAPKPVS